MTTETFVILERSSPAEAYKFWTHRIFSREDLALDELAEHIRTKCNPVDEGHFLKRIIDKEIRVVPAKIVIGST